MQTRIEYPQPSISVVIPNHNGKAFLQDCLRSLQDQAGSGMEIIVVDNASTDGSVESVRHLAPAARVLVQEENVGFAAGANAGIRAARGGWVAVLNNDARVAPDWFAACLEALGRHPDAAFLACRIFEASEGGRIYSAGDCFLRAGIGYRRGQSQPDCAEFRQECEIFSACGCAALYRRDILTEMGGFDERFFAYLEDVELGLRLQAAGCRGYYVPAARVYHHGGSTSGGEFSPLSVCLRTRNALLLLCKSLPGPILCRCLPMIAAAQISWLARAAARGRLAAYAKGLGSACRLLPPMLRDRRRARAGWGGRRRDLWRRILESESLAGRGLAPEASGSRFLKWYFRLFRAGV